jgi:phosphonate transport system substrate-binding protein
MRPLVFNLILLIFVSLLPLGCSLQKDALEVDLKKTVKVLDTEKNAAPEISISVGSMITPQEGYIYYKELLDYIGEKMGMKVNFVERGSYREVNDLLEGGKVEVAFVCGGPYVEGHEKFGLELLAAPRVKGKTEYYSYIIVKKESAIKKVEELKEKTFAFADPLSNTGHLAPRFMLSKMGESPDSFFKEYDFTYGHDKSIKAVALGVVDGAAVDSLIWEYLIKNASRHAENTRIIKVLGPYGIPPVVVNPKLNTKTKDKIRNILLSLHKDEAGKKILNGMSIDEFTLIDDSAYDSIRELKVFKDQ